VIEVIDPGPLTTVQDLGRPGHAHLGVARSGAADRPALRLANRLVGNPEERAALESTLRGPRLRFHTAAIFALTGAPTKARLDGRELAMNHAVRAHADSHLDVGTASAGLRTYVAFAGGLDVPQVLGSSSTDVLGGLGPPPLRTGDLLALHPPCGLPPAIDAVPVTAPSTHAELSLLRGPRDDWFAPAAWATLGRETYVVQADSNRVGIRLSGAPLKRRTMRELRSEGMVAGALQVPPSGQPILLLADHPPTGGYPVIGVVTERDLAAAAQLRPGATVRFRTSVAAR
jgi:biotin-dependent carboxylase-like uncharacterized protein